MFFAEETLRNFIAENPEYPLEAYRFVREGFEYSLSRAASSPRTGSGRAPYDLPASELAISLKDYALEKYGPMARFALSRWGIRTTADFGAIVYNLIAMGLLSAGKDDKESDFGGLFDLGEMLAKPYGDGECTGEERKWQQKRRSRQREF